MAGDGETALREVRRADLAVTFAEDVILMAEGRIIRHHVMDFRRVREASPPGE